VIAVGGCGNNGKYAGVEILRNLDGKWRNMKPMNTPRNRFAVVLCDGQIYAIGGKFPKGILKSVEKFDFDSNSWSYVGYLNNPRFGHAACVFQERIFVVGGIYRDCKTSLGSRISRDKMECYNLRKNIWTITENHADLRSVLRPSH